MGWILSQWIDASNYHDVHFQYLPILFFNYTSRKLKIFKIFYLPKNKHTVSQLGREKMSGNWVCAEKALKQLEGPLPLKPDQQAHPVHRPTGSKPLNYCPLLPLCCSSTFYRHTHLSHFLLIKCTHVLTLKIKAKFKALKN